MVERIIFSLDRLNLPTPKVEERREKKEGTEGSFLKLVEDGIRKVNELEKRADDLSQKLVTGEVDDVHEVAIAVRKAELAVRLLTEIRNRLVDAYDRLTRLT